MTRLFVSAALLATAISAQSAPESKQAEPTKQLVDRSTPATDYVIAAGTKIPLSLINSVSTKHAAEGDRVYLETVFPILDKGKIVIPPGSWVAGTITQVKRPGRQIRQIVDLGDNGFDFVALAGEVLPDIAVNLLIGQWQQP